MQDPIERADALAAIALGDTVNQLQAKLRAIPRAPVIDPAAIREAWEKAYWRMRSYAVHDNDCKLNKPPRFDGPCSCGLTAALEEALALIQKGAADDIPSVVQNPTAQHLVPEVR